MRPSFLAGETVRVHAQRRGSGRHGGQIDSVGAGGISLDRFDRMDGRRLLLVSFRREHCFPVGCLEAETVFASLVLIDFEFVHDLCASFRAVVFQPQLCSASITFATENRRSG
ncbi:hypothetical protein AGR7C_Cc260419 [Agrobacterium deltaense Zutra 3/1]|uniref:Uncharacterized protein n=1 Tax=Agrobacterium deltaense Zutra 3/1 TaxID=1183427 RepID=A0A1S7QC35_9HYPH|nr:hypothetical protein AGR7C_Cc260419 [Agrobacterium deltaense Zutra 3/1]